MIFAAVAVGKYAFFLKSYVPLTLLLRFVIIEVRAAAEGKGGGGRAPPPPGPPPAGPPRGMRLSRLGGPRALRAGGPRPLRDGGTECLEVAVGLLPAEPELGVVDTLPCGPGARLLLCAKDNSAEP